MKPTPSHYSSLCFIAPVPCALFLSQKSKGKKKKKKSEISKNQNPRKKETLEEDFFESKRRRDLGEMMVEKEDLGLSLSLMSSSSTTEKNHHHHHRLQLNLMPSSSSLQKEGSWNEAFVSSDRNTETRSFLRGIDVNRMPPSSSTTIDCEEEAGVSSPNSTVSSISGKRSERDTNGEENDIERDCSRSDEEDGDTSRKKLRLSKDQSAILEESFKEHNTLNPKQKLALAKQLNLRPRQVEVWFQNRRARTKLKQTEVDCEFLKRCCENLTEENRRLQKEVQELRALKMSPQFYMQMTPPTTLTMCPSCERVAVSSSSNNAAAAPSAPVDGSNHHHHHHHQHHQQQQQQRAALPINALPINAWGPPNPIQQHNRS